MSCGVTCRINSGWKMLSVQQCMRNTLIKNKELLICRGFNSIKKASKSISFVKFCHQTIRDGTLCNGQWRSNIISKNHHQFLFPLACNTYSTECQRNVDDKKPEEAKLSLYQKLKKMYKEYWYVLVPVHLITSCFWFGSFYYLAISGIDIPALMQSFGAPDTWVENLKTSKAGNLVLAYALYKVITPVRYTVTLGGTTISINYLKKWGWIKPVPNKEQFKKMYQDQKDAFKDLKASYHDKMQVTKNEFMKTKKDLEKQYEEAKKDFHRSIKETRDDFKGGVKDGADEWRAIGGEISKAIKQTFPGKK